MRGIDLYSGIGGWTLGFRAAGANMVCSYEIWPLANSTHGLNGGATPPNRDIRALALSDLPEPGTVDFVVGSPPCTQFSFANRGGNGDLADGLVDIRKFLEIVRYLKPKLWAMENVPRVAGILEAQLGLGGDLEEFADLVRYILVVDASEFGLAQARKRMIAGHFDAELFLSYRARCKPKTLGDVVRVLALEEVVDPNWGFSVSRSKLTDHEFEAPLGHEEERINRDAKTHHPVYNKMSFPDRLERPSRTVTATCTRVSRESIVVNGPSGFRRLTIRERALLQGFPATFQFASGTYSDRAKMVGNAIPPVLTYYVAQAMQGVQANELVLLEAQGYVHEPLHVGASATPDGADRSYPAKRSFRCAIPGLRFHSGVRFELKNTFMVENASWAVDFYYGNSKRILHADMGQARIEANLAEYGLENLIKEAKHLVDAELGVFLEVPGNELQSRWSGRSKGPGPFDIADGIGRVVSQIGSRDLANDADIGRALVAGLYPGINTTKLQASWRQILIGSAVGSVVNSRLVGPTRSRPLQAELLLAV